MTDSDDWENDKTPVDRPRARKARPALTRQETEVPRDEVTLKTAGRLTNHGLLVAGAIIIAVDVVAFWLGYWWAGF